MGSTLACTDHSYSVCLRQRATISSPLSWPTLSRVLVAISVPYAPSRRSVAERPARAELDLASGEVVGRRSEGGAGHVRDVLHVVAIEEVESLDQHGQGVLAPEAKHLLETRVERAVG